MELFQRYIQLAFLFLWGGPNLFHIIHPREVGCSETMYQYLARVCPICIIFVFNLLLPPAAILGGCLVRNISFFQHKKGFLWLCQ